jgi:hypothetical protein
MSNNVSSDFKAGHDHGHRDAKAEASKSELAKWVDAGTELIFGSDKTPRSSDYKNGERQGWKDHQNKK